MTKPAEESVRRPPLEAAASAAQTTVEDHYRGLFASMQEALLVAELIDRPGHPTDFRYIDVNPAAERILGLSRAQIVGRTGRELIPNIQEELVELSARVVRTGVPETREVYEPLFQQFHHSVFFRPAPGQVAVVFSDVTERKRTQQALSETAASLSRERERLAIALRAGRMGAFEWQIGADEIWCSPEAYTIFGIEPRAVRPTLQRFHTFVHPDDRDALWKAARNAIDRGEPWSHEYRIVRPDGAIRWIAQSSQLARDAAEGGGRLTGVIADITERTEVQHRLDVLISSIDDHLASYDRQWRFTFVNEAAAQMLGRSREELLGRSIWELFPDAVGNQYYRELHAALRENRPIRSEHYYAPFDRWFENYIYPSVEGVTVFASDISARKRAEAALRESEERFRVTADGLELIVWVHGPGGAPEFVNTRFCEFFGVNRDEMRHIRWEVLVHPDDHKRYVDAFHAALAEHTPFHEIARARRADGAWRWVESWGRPRFSGSGEFTGIVGASADVTEHLAAQEALREADHRKDEFLALLAHELRNPLAAIKSAVDLLHVAAGDAPETPAALRILDRQVRHMVRQIDDLLDVSRISRGSIELRLERIDVAQVVRQALEAAAIRRPSNDRTLDAVLPPHPVHITGDSTRLVQVIGNLLSNAFKFTEPGGQIRLELSEEDRWAVVRVQDTGIGIPTDQLERVFDMFVQLDTSFERARGGLGIGLSLVKKLVEQHGGTVAAQSAGPGTGSAFTVRLPRADAAEAPDPAKSEVKSVSAPRRILVVDDNHDSADMLSVLLGLAGHEVTTAYDGAEALEKAASFNPDVVLLDIGMPGLNGYEVARRLRERNGAALRLVALTGWGQDADRRRSSEAGFDAHLVKPVELERINALLAGWTGR